MRVIWCVSLSHPLQYLPKLVRLFHAAGRAHSHLVQSANTERPHAARRTTANGGCTVTAV